MTTKELIVAVIDGSEAGTPKLACYEPALTNASRNKRGLTTLTFKVRVSDFTPNDALNGMKAWLCVGTVDALKELTSREATKGRRNGDE